MSFTQSPTTDLKSSNLLFMLQRKITNPSPLQLKILTELEDNIPKLYRPQDDFKLANITIYTEKSVFQGKLTGKCIAKQLSWNAESLNTLLECLTGKRDKVEMKFFPVSKGNSDSIHNFEIICQISSGINLTLFTVELHQSKTQNPFMHMKQKFSSLERTFRDRQRGYKQKQERLKGQLNEIEAVEKQIIYSSSTEITLMKKEFIKHVNKEKAKIRKLMGSVPMINPVSGMIENRGVAVGKNLDRIPEKQNQQEELQRTQSMKKNRDVKKVDRQRYIKPMPQKLQVQESQSQQKYFSSNSNNPSQIYQEEFKRQKPHGEKRRNRFTEDNGSSSDEEDNYGQSQGNKVEKTFLEQERERIETEKRQNKGEHKQNEEDYWDGMFS